MAVLLRSVSKVRPRVGLMFRHENRKGMWVNFVSDYHLQMLFETGSVPVPIPCVSGIKGALDQYVTSGGGLHGLLMVEGDDIDPQFVHTINETRGLVRETDPLKDDIELRLLRHALTADLPILGICRGSQLLNLACGGTLYNDVQKELPSAIDHRLSSTNTDFRHTVKLVPNTPLHRWYDGRSELKVNSYHHQGVRQLAPRFRPMAVCEDGLIEGFYDPLKRFVVGMQFHPERLTANEYLPSNRAVYQRFSDACAARAAERAGSTDASIASRWALATMPRLWRRVNVASAAAPNVLKPLMVPLLPGAGVAHLHALVRERLKLRPPGTRRPIPVHSGAVALHATTSAEAAAATNAAAQDDVKVRVMTLKGAEIDDTEQLREDEVLMVEVVGAAPSAATLQVEGGHPQSFRSDGEPF